MNFLSHRGVHHQHKANSILAFEQAVTSKFDFVEFDVRRLAEGTLVVSHDPKIQGVPLRSINYATLMSIDPDIPTLTQVLQTISPKIKLDIELKETGYEIEVIQTTMRFLGIDNFIITSFHPRSLIKIHKAFPLIKTGLLISPNTIANLLYLHSFNLVLPKLILITCAPWLFKDLTKEVIIWDICKQADYERLASVGNISGLITDNDLPELLA